MKRSVTYKSLLPLGVVLVALPLGVCAQQNTYFSNWPAGLSPQEVGKQVSEHFVTSPHQYGPTRSVPVARATGNARRRNAAEVKAVKQKKTNRRSLH
jgi:hypothetical protein